MIDEIIKKIDNADIKLGNLFSIRFTREEYTFLTRALKELKFRREFMRPLDELYGDDNNLEYSPETLIDYFNRRFTDIERRLELLSTVKTEPICKHCWVLKSSSTGGNTYQCSECGQWKTETWSAGTGGRISW